MGQLSTDLPISPEKAHACLVCKTTAIGPLDRPPHGWLMVSAQTHDTKFSLTWCKFCAPSPSFALGVLKKRLED